MYIQACFHTTDNEVREILIALLSEEGYDSFEETGDSLLAYIPEGQFDNSIPRVLGANYGIEVATQRIEQENWNANWERDFQPVVVEGFCTVRAGFHKMEIDTPYEVVITPKMSFGTGHHATTRLMITRMKDLAFEGKSVFDFGTGTGILAILAEMLGAKNITAIDNDEWSYLNAKENSGNNGCTKIELLQGTLEDLPRERYDIILANINRHILLQYIQPLFDRLNDKGIILMSGLLKEDKEIISAGAADAGFSMMDTGELNNWIYIAFSK